MSKQVGLKLTDLMFIKACLYDPAKAGRDVFISPRRETRLGGMACLYEQKHYIAGMKPFKCLT